MKKLLLLAIILCFLLVPSSILAGTEQLTFQWEQVISADFYGWKIWIGETAGGPYTQFGEDIVYDGSPQPNYSIAKVLTSPDGQEKTYYFVATAGDLSGNDSGYSNEVSAVIDFLAPNVPVTLTVEVEPTP